MAYTQIQSVRCKKCAWEQELWTWKSNPFRRIWEAFIWCVYPRMLYEDDVYILRACRVFGDIKLVHSYRYFAYKLKQEIIGMCNQRFTTRGAYSRAFHKHHGKTLQNIPCPHPTCEGTLEFNVSCHG